MSNFTKRRSNSLYKPPDREREQREAAEKEAERLGRVAHHHGKLESDCPYAPDDPLREKWVAGLLTAGSRRNRADMKPAHAAGFRAFQDGLHRAECPFGLVTPDRTEWMEGWEKAERVKQQYDDEHYR